jgi:heme/copper-type cytochrome/quinol oxidase subunit 2
MNQRILVPTLTLATRFLPPSLLLLVPFAVILGLEAGAVRSIDVTVSQYAFSPARIEVSVGEQVRLNIRSADVPHGFQVKALGIKALIPAGGEPLVVEFTTREAGTFPITCSEYCGRGHSRMTATLVAIAPK